ncbi:MAG: hypothetical protein WBX25_32710, partial [Rhodomicrobium sp.]
ASDQRDRGAAALEHRHTSEAWRRCLSRTVSSPQSRAGHMTLTHNGTGVDTGAFWTGKLTAVGPEGSRRWFLST